MPGFRVSNVFSTLEKQRLGAFERANRVAAGAKSYISPLKDAAATRWWKRASIEDDKGERQDVDAEKEREREGEIEGDIPAGQRDAIIHGDKRYAVLEFFGPFFFLFV